jgi:hypothetical protein
LKGKQIMTDTANLPAADYIDPVEELAREARDNIENALKFNKGK